MSSPCWEVGVGVAYGQKTQTLKSLVQHAGCRQWKGWAKDRHIHRLWLLTMIPDLLSPKNSPIFPPASFRLIGLEI